MLKQLIMKKASEEMRAEMQKRQKEKDDYLQKVLPALKLDGLNKGESFSLPVLTCLQKQKVLLTLCVLERWNHYICEFSQ